MRIAIYSRKSKFTGKGESIGNQIEMCRDYIATNYNGEEHYKYLKMKALAVKILTDHNLKK